MHKDICTHNPTYKCTGNTYTAWEQVGTVAYMSPERLRVDEGVGYSFAADVWAAGLIAGECACGVHLYPEEVPGPTILPTSTLHDVCGIDAYIWYIHRHLLIVGIAQPPA